MILQLLKYSLSLPAMLILQLMGWSFLDDQAYQYMNNNARMVCVFSHTSYYDFFLMVLYYFAHPNQLTHLKTLINPYYFNYIGFFLRFVGGIPAIKVDNIVEELLKTPKSHFLISPKGTILKGEWRSGYYHIARKLNCPILALGLDYELKKIIICRPVLSIYDEHHIQDLLYKDLSKIVPLHPEQENMIIRNHKQPSVINKKYLFLTIVSSLSCLIGSYLFKI